MWADLLPAAIEGGSLAVIAGVFGLLHRSVVAAYRQQTTDWRESYRLEREAHDQTREQLIHVLSPLSEAS